MRYRVILTESFVYEVNAATPAMALAIVMNEAEGDILMQRRDLGEVLDDVGIHKTGAEHRTGEAK